MRDRPASPFALMSVLAALLLSSMRVTAADSRLYDSRCSLCHQGKAVGVPGQFPRLAGRVREIASRPEGRRYLLHVVLFGLAGKIEIDGTPLVGLMPSFAALSDEELAAALNYLISLNGKETVKHAPKPFTTAEIHEARAQAAQTPTQVRSERDAVVAPIA